MERVGNKARSFEDARRWECEQAWAMTPDERMAVACVLRERVWGRQCLDVREGQRQIDAEVRGGVATHEG